MEDKTGEKIWAREECDKEDRKGAAVGGEIEKGKRVILAGQQLIYHG